jgi:hypothetical protein
MKYLHLLFKRFFPNSKIDKPTTSIEDEYVSGICFNLTKQSDVDIIALLPDMEKIDDNDIGDLAEKYAQLILAINHGLLKNKLLEILSYKAESSSNYKEQLFIDNVITFYDIFKLELNKLQYNNQSPLIKPSSVFKAK